MAMLAVQPFSERLAETIWILFILSIYLIPAIIAYWRKHNWRFWITFVNVFLGWTLLGWLFALFWSFTDPKK